MAGWNMKVLAESTEISRNRRARKKGWQTSICQPLIQILVGVKPLERYLETRMIIGFRR
jgi:hypothetical protein